MVIGTIIKKYGGNKMKIPTVKSLILVLSFITMAQLSYGQQTGRDIMLRVN